MDKQRQRKLAARARRMEALHPTSNNEIATNKETKVIKDDVQPTKAKSEKKQKENATKNDKIKSGSVQKVNKIKKDVSKKKHNSKGRE